MKCRAGAVVLASAVTAFAIQDKPDFSGRWVRVAPDRSTTEIADGVVVRQTRRTVGSGSMTGALTEIAVDRQFGTETRSEHAAIGIVGGSVPGLQADGTSGTTPKTRFGVTWDGSALVFERSTYTGDSPGTGVWSSRRETWLLEPDGRLRVTIATAGSTEAAATVTALYRRGD